MPTSKQWRLNGSLLNIREFTSFIEAEVMTYLDINTSPETSRLDDEFDDGKLTNFRDHTKLSELTDLAAKELHELIKNRRSSRRFQH